MSTNNDTTPDDSDTGQPLTAVGDDAVRGDGSLTLTGQASVETHVTLTEMTPSAFHHEFATSADVREAAIDAVRDLAAGHDVAGLLDELDEREIAAPGHALQSTIVAIAKGDRRAVWNLVDTLPQLGQGTSPFDEALALPRLLAAGDATPTVTVRLERDWFDVRRDQREATCRYLAALANAVDLRIVATGLTQRRLAREHRIDLPGVDEQCSTRGSESPTDDVVATAWEALDADGSCVEILRTIADASSRSRTFSELYSAVPLADATVRNHLATLDDLSLVSKFDAHGGGRAVEALEAGLAYLDAVDEEIGRQRRLSDCVDDSPNPSDNAVLSSARTGGGTGDGTHRYRLPSLHTPEYMSRRETIQAAHTPPEAGVSVVNYPVEPKEDRAEGGWSYDSAADRMVVSAEYDNPLQFWVTVAVTLTDWRTFDHVLDEDRLTDTDLGDLVDEHRGLLRTTRCLGYLADGLEDAVDYADALQEARDDLVEMTRTLRSEEYEVSTEEFRSTITREAIGLAGTVSHVLDLAGVDVVREVRLPEFSRNFDVDRRDELVRTLSIGSAILSRYGHHVAYRQLYESRAEKREQAITPTVDADDPYGELLGRWCVVGDLGGKADDLADGLRDALGSPADVHDDAPEFAVEIPVDVEHGRDQYAAVVRRACRARNLRATRETVSVVQALAATPYDAVDAIHQLGREDTPREIRVDEVRYALAHLDADRLLRGATPTPRAVIRALLTADRPLSTADLADRADVSTESLRQHLPRLEGMGLVATTDDGVRLQLSFHGDDERHADVLPWLVTDDLARPADALYDVAAAVIDDASRFGDPDDPVFGVWVNPPDGVPDVDRLREPWPWLSWGLPLVRALCGDTDTEPEPTRVRLGPQVGQASLQASTAGGEAT